MTQQVLAALEAAARDAMQDDFPTVRHEGQRRLDGLLAEIGKTMTPAEVLAYAEKARCEEGGRTV